MSGAETSREMDIKINKNESNFRHQSLFRIQIKVKYLHLSQSSNHIQGYPGTMSFDFPIEMMSNWYSLMLNIK